MEEEAWVTERNVRFGLGVRGGTHIVNMTVLVTEMTGSSPLGLLLNFVVIGDKPKDAPEVGEVTTGPTEKNT